jgi:hypothetical protein
MIQAAAAHESMINSALWLGKKYAYAVLNRIQQSPMAAKT